MRLLAIHGRTRACGFRGEAEYETIAEVKAGVRIPVIANGDIATPEEARRVLALTGADGIMIGRAAHGRPWIFREFSYFLNEGKKLPPPAAPEMRSVVLEHLEGIYSLYGEELGLRIARKHIGWYTRGLPGGEAFRREANAIESAAAQLAAVGRFFRREAWLAMSRNTELADAVKRSLERYFKDMDGEQPTAIYDMVLKNIERPMIETVLGKAAGNQSAAAAMLGIDRNTLRKKIQQLRIKA